jgi:hypothetical protein
MWKWILVLDNVLRGQATRPAAVREGIIDVPVGGLSIVIGTLGMLYGICMGVFSLRAGGLDHAIQLFASMIKVPALFALTLIVTFPSLYVFNALVGSQLMIGSLLRLLVTSLAVTLAVLSSIGPIVAFFSFTTTSYPFMMVLNVMVFAMAGMLGLMFLWQTLRRMSAKSEIQPSDLKLSDPVPLPANTPVLADLTNPGPLDAAAPQFLTAHVRIIFSIWMFAFGLVGAQMSWVLRPFIGNPEQPFTWFRPINSNFFEAVVHAITKLI